MDYSYIFTTLNSKTLKIGRPFYDDIFRNIITLLVNIKNTRLEFRKSSIVINSKVLFIFIEGSLTFIIRYCNDNLFSEALHFSPYKCNISVI